MIRWRGEPDPKHVKAVDAYWTSAAEHGMNASTFTARVIASTGADVAAALSGAVGAMSGPLHGGAPSRVLGMIEEIERTGDADGVREAGAGQGRAADGLRAPRLPRRGPAGARAAPYGQGAGRAALRGRRGAGAGGAGGAAQPPPGPGAGDERGVLGGDHAGLRGGPGAHVHVDVHLRPYGGLVGAHPGAEAHGPAGAALGALRRAGRRATRARSPGTETCTTDTRCRRAPGRACTGARTAVDERAGSGGGRRSLSPR